MPIWSPVNQTDPWPFIVSIYLRKTTVLFVICDWCLSLGSFLRIELTSLNIVLSTGLIASSVIRYSTVITSNCRPKPVYFSPSLGVVSITVVSHSHLYGVYSWKTSSLLFPIIDTPSFIWSDFIKLSSDKFAFFLSVRLLLLFRTYIQTTTLFMDLNDVIP